MTPQRRPGRCAPLATIDSARSALSVLSVLLLMSCSAGSVPRSYFYRIDTSVGSNAAASGPTLNGVLVVERFSADGLVDERPILYSNGTSLEVRQHHYHYWVEPPTDMLQEQMAAYLRAQNAATMVTTPEMRVPPDYVLRGRLNRFERTLGTGSDEVLIETRMSLTDVGKNQLLWTDTYRVKVEPAGDDMLAAIEAFNRGVMTIFARFTRDIGN